MQEHKSRLRDNSLRCSKQASHDSQKHSQQLPGYECGIQEKCKGEQRGRPQSKGAGSGCLKIHRSTQLAGSESGIQEESQHWRQGVGTLLQRYTRLSADWPR